MSHATTSERIIFRQLFAGVALAFLLSACNSVGSDTAVSVGKLDGQIPSEFPGWGAPLSVMTYNIRVGYGSKNTSLGPWKLRHQKKSLPPIVLAIRSINPDIVGLQEVLSAGQAEQLARALNMNYVYAAHPPSSDWWGLAVLSKFKILATRTSAISSDRGILISTLDISGRRVAMVNVHKDHRLTDGASVRAILSAVEMIQDPLILLGDFNISPIEARTKMITARYLDTAVAAQTESAERARFEGTYLDGDRIDYVFVRPQEFAVQDAGVLSEEHWSASDHLAYYAVIVPRAP